MTAGFALATSHIGTTGKRLSDSGGRNRKMRIIIPMKSRHSWIITVLIVTFPVMGIAGMMNIHCLGFSDPAAAQIKFSSEKHCASGDAPVIVTEPSLSTKCSCDCGDTPGCLNTGANFFASTIHSKPTMVLRGARHTSDQVTQPVSFHPAPLIRPPIPRPLILGRKADFRFAGNFHTTRRLVARAAAIDRVIIMNKIKNLNIVVLLFLLCGCTSILPDHGMSDVNALLTQRGISTTAADAENTDAAVKSLLSEPVSLDGAVQIALINNTELHQAYATLGVAAGDVYAARRIRNPVVSFSQLDSDRSGERDLITFGFIASLSDMITLPFRKKLAETQFAASKQSVVADVLRILRDVQTSYYEYAAAIQIRALKKQQHKISELSARLAQRYYDAGNMSERERSEQHVKVSDALFESFVAETNALNARTKLANLLGLSVAAPWRINAEFLLPPNAEIDVEKLSDTATRSRPDLNAAKLEAERLAKQLGITDWTHYLGELDAGAERERDADGAKLTGPVLSWEAPIFTQKNDRKLRIAGELKIAMLEVRKLSHEIRNEVHANYLKTKNARALIHEYRHKLIPNRSNIVSRAQEEENFMLIGTFELIDTKQDEYESYAGFIEAIRDYWIAYADLMHAAGGLLSLSAGRTRMFSTLKHS